jgi:hypothetical protein
MGQFFLSVLLSLEAARDARLPSSICFQAVILDCNVSLYRYRAKRKATKLYGMEEIKHVLTIGENLSQIALSQRVALLVAETERKNPSVPLAQVFAPP